MSYLLQDMLVHLKSNGIISEEAVDGFRDLLPDQPNTCIALLEYVGAASHTADVTQRSVQVQSRSSSYNTAHAKAWEAYTLWYLPESDVRKIDFTPTRWGIVSMRTQPYLLRRDESDRIIFAFNMGITTFSDS